MTHRRSQAYVTDPSSASIESQRRGRSSEGLTEGWFLGRLRGLAREGGQTTPQVAFGRLRRLADLPRRSGHDDPGRAHARALALGRPTLARSTVKGRSSATGEVHLTRYAGHRSVRVAPVLPRGSSDQVGPPEASPRLARAFGRLGRQPPAAGPAAPNEPGLSPWPPRGPGRPGPRQGGRPAPGRASRRRSRARSPRRRRSTRDPRRARRRCRS